MMNEITSTLNQNQWTQSIKIKQNTKSDLNIKFNENVKKSVPTSHGGPSMLWRHTWETSNDENANSKHHKW